MPIELIDRAVDNPPDNSPTLQYNVKVTQRDMDELNHLVKRNFAGMTIAWTPAMIAVVKTVHQITQQNKDAVDNCSCNQL